LVYFRSIYITHSMIIEIKHTIKNKGFIKIVKYILLVLLMMLK
jgi:hypothetical protein